MERWSNGVTPGTPRLNLHHLAICINSSAPFLSTMRRVPHLLLAILSLAIVSSASATDRRVPPNTEWIILVGGPSMYQWEKYKAEPHDHWWANFVHAARLRTEEIRAQYGPEQKITWLIYRPGYEDRA